MTCVSFSQFRMLLLVLLVVSENLIIIITILTRDMLHWLPIKQRINFKIAVLTYKALHQQAPCYITSMCHLASDSSGLICHRSATNSELIPASWNSVFYGKRSFYYAAPKVWNSLPVFTRHQNSFAAFTKDLKTVLFNQAYFA